MDIHIITKKTTNVPDRLGLVKKKYVFTLKNITIVNEKNLMTVYYTIRTVNDGAKNFVGSTVINSYTDNIPINFLEEYCGTFKGLVIKKFIQYASENMLFGFSEYEEFIEIKN